jgi:Stress responsive A/B Barrel Domain
MRREPLIFHINRLTFKSDIDEERRRACLDAARQAGEANPAVRSFVVGRELGGEFEWSAVYVVDDLDGYWQYLTHPAHVRSEMTGIELTERFEAIDVTDSDDPEAGEKIARLQARHFQESPSWPRWWPRRPHSRCPAARARTLRPADRRRPDRVAPQR